MLKARRTPSLAADDDHALTADIDQGVGTRELEVVLTTHVEPRPGEPTVLLEREYVRIVKDARRQQARSIHWLARGGQLCQRRHAA